MIKVKIEDLDHFIESHEYSEISAQDQIKELEDQVKKQIEKTNSVPLCVLTSYSENGRSVFDVMEADGLAKSFTYFFNTTVS